jgi:toxin-antitoxin system PIN domain toxin
VIIPDANLVIYAHDQSSTHHLKAKHWWEGALSGREPVVIPFVVVTAFMRLVTHPTLNENPMSVAMARESIESWEKVPVVRFVSGTPDTLRLAWDLLEEAEAGGNLTTDAVIAAHSIESGGTVYSNDRDFGRFEKLRWINPLEV